MNSRVSKTTCLGGTSEQPRSASTTRLPIDANDADPVAGSNGGAGDPCCRQVRPCRSCRQRPQKHQGTGRSHTYAWLVAGPVLAGAHEPRDLRRGHAGPVSTNRVERHAPERSSGIGPTRGHDAGRAFCLETVRRSSMHFSPVSSYGGRAGLKPRPSGRVGEKSGLEETVRTGQPSFERVYGAPFFEYLAGHSEDAAVFNTAMSSSPDYLAAIVGAYDFSKFDES